jgi:2-polyprenyl-3-methyl-5-hydroxy-6-metoxy-1,4-benzoquinol methylase
MKKHTKDSFKYIQADKFGWGENSKPNKQRERLILDNIKGNEIIDIGCGTGMWTKFLAKNGFNVTGVDKQKSFIKRAQRIKAAQFVHAPAEKLPFSENQFDTALLINLLEHVDNDLAVLKQAAKVARRVIFNVPQQTPDDLFNKGVIYKHYIDNTHQRTYSKKTLKELVKKSGLKLVFIQEVEPLPAKWLVYELVDGSSFIKKLLVSILFVFLKPKKHHLELFGVAKIE